MSDYGYHFGSLIYIIQEIRHVSMYETLHGSLLSDILVTYYKIRHNILVGECERVNPHQHGYKHSHIGTTRVNFDPVYIFCQVKSKCVQHHHSCYVFVFLHNFHQI